MGGGGARGNTVRMWDRVQQPNSCQFWSRHVNQQEALAWKAWQNSSHLVLLCSSECVLTVIGSRPMSMQLAHTGIARLKM